MHCDGCNLKITEYDKCDCGRVYCNELMCRVLFGQNTYEKWCIVCVEDRYEEKKNKISKSLNVIIEEFIKTNFIWEVEGRRLPYIYPFEDLENISSDLCKFLIDKLKCGDYKKRRIRRLFT